MPRIITNSANNNVLADKLLVADNFFARLKGLIGKKSLEPGEGLLLVPCNSVHTMFMKFDIDVIFLDAGYKILKMIPGLVPWRISIPVPGAKYVLELPPGTIKATGTKTGDCLVVQEK